MEQAPEFGEVGAGIQLAANATNILQRLGVMEKINEITVFPKRLVLKDVFTGKELSALNVQDAYIERYGAPYVVLHRADLLDVLLEACKEQPNIELYTNQRIVNIEQNDNSVTVTAESGATHTGEALVVQTVFGHKHVNWLVMITQYVLVM